MAKDFFIYILQCSNGSYYTGYTTNLSRRYAEHLQGTTKSKFTRSFKPIGIAQSWKIVGDKAIALKFERAIKKLNKKEKIKLIQNPEKLYEMEF